MRFDFDKEKSPELPFPDVTPINNKVLKEITMQQTAKYCGISYKKFLSILVSKQILGMSSDGRYLPFQKYKSLQWFIQRGIMLDKAGFRGLIQKVTVTPLGYTEIKKIIHGE
jgi:phage antirepressor YoqD-like protein